MTTKKEDILRKVRGLLDKAESTTFPDERNALMAKADQLMTAYAIESFEINMSRPEAQREKPEARTYIYDHSSETILGVMSPIFWHLSKLCRCEMGSYGWSRSVVVGFPADLDYLDLLLTSIQLQLVATMEPRIDETQDYRQNLYNLKSAGYKWQRCYEELVVAFPEKFEKALVPAEEVEIYGGTSRRFIYAKGKHYYRTMPRNIGVRFTGEYKRHCEENNLDRVMSNPETYRRNFAEAFAAELGRRIRQMMNAQAETTEGHGLVLASREGDIKTVLWDLYPHLKPHDADCDCRQCHVSKCRDSSCKRQECVDARSRRNKPVRYARVAEKKYDAAAASAGARSARQVDLSGGRGHLTTNKELK